MFFKKIEKNYLESLLNKQIGEIILSKKYIENDELQARFKMLEKRAKDELIENKLVSLRESIQSLKEFKVEVLNNEEVIPALNSMAESVSNSTFSDQMKKKYIDNIQTIQAQNINLPNARALLKRILNRLHSEAQKHEWKLNIYETSLKFFIGVTLIIIILILLNIGFGIPFEKNNFSVRFIIQMGLFGALGASLNGIRSIRKTDLSLSMYHVLIISTMGRPIFGFAIGIISFYILLSKIIIIPGIEKHVGGYLCFAFIGGFSENQFQKIIGSIDQHEKNKRKKG